MEERSLSSILRSNLVTTLTNNDVSGKVNASGVGEGFGQISRNAGVVLALLRNTWGLKDQVKLCQDKTRPLCSVLKLSAVRGSVSSRSFVPPLNCDQSLSCLLISVLRASNKTSTPAA